MLTNSSFIETRAVSSNEIFFGTIFKIFTNENFLESITLKFRLLRLSKFI